ncbi:MAG: type II toxin-antitoxin system VapC family toxin [Gammaproteobacteria bacterium]
MIRTFVDSGVLIAAVCGTEEVANEAMEILDDPRRAFITSDFVRLEVMPKAVYHKKEGEIEFYKAFFQEARRTIRASKALVSRAHDKACRFGLAAVDALHVAAAEKGGSDELITTEKKSKPLFRVHGIRVTTIRPDKKQGA